MHEFQDITLFIGKFVRCMYIENRINLFSTTIYSLFDKLEYTAKYNFV